MQSCAETARDTVWNKSGEKYFPEAYKAFQKEITMNKKILEQFWAYTEGKETFESSIAYTEGSFDLDKRLEEVRKIKMVPVYDKYHEARKLKIKKWEEQRDKQRAAEMKKELEEAREAEKEQSRDTAKPMSDAKTKSKSEESPKSKSETSSKSKEDAKSQKKKESKKFKNNYWQIFKREKK